MTYYVGENVIVHANVVIASGVVLEAAPGSRVIVGAGTCIGAGTVVQAYGGDLILAVGVSLGKDVLLLGQGTVGQKACIGAESTVVNPAIRANQVIAARSLLIAASGNRSEPKVTPEQAQNNGSAVTSEGVEASALSNGSVVYGRDQVMRLVHTLFPHRQPLNAKE